MYNLVSQSKSDKLIKWKDFFDSVEEELIKNQKILNDKYNYKDIIPLENEVFRAFELTNPEDIKVVIFGQDPYKTYIDGNRPTATGIAFSANTITPSLINIFKEIGIGERENGNLENWCKQGVLLINSSLTISRNEKIGDFKIWLGFLYKLIEFITEFNEEIIYMLWGKESIGLEDELKLNSTIFKSSHPSPLSANKKCGDYHSFIGSNQFNKCNEKLIKLKFTPIDWS